MARRLQVISICELDEEMKEKGKERIERKRRFSMGPFRAFAGWAAIFYE